MILSKVATPNSLFLPCLSQQLFARSSYRVICCSARPCKAIFTGVPMLLALDEPTYPPLVSSGDGPLRGRRQVVWEGIAQVWAVIASVIESSEPQEISLEVHTSLSPPQIWHSPINHCRPSDPCPSRLSYQRSPEPRTERPNPFLSGDAPDSPAPSLPLGSIMDPEVPPTALASSGKLHEMTQLDRQGILRRLSASALTNCMRNLMPPFLSAMENAPHDAPHDHPLRLERSASAPCDHM